jgi:hypothetical protein
MLQFIDSGWEAGASASAGAGTGEKTIGEIETGCVLVHGARRCRFAPRRRAPPPDRLRYPAPGMRFGPYADGASLKNR